MTGRGGNLANDNFNRGIALFDNAVVESTSGPITLEGTGGSGNTGMRGIQIGNQGIRIRSVDGDITLRGTGGSGNGGFHNGVIFFDGSVESTGNATITIDGVAGSGGASNIGVLIFNPGSTVTSSVGAITINGTGGTGASDFNNGVQIASGASVRSTGTGQDAASISINGQGGTADEFNRGIQLSGTNPQITTIDGDIELRGTGGNGNEGQIGIILFQGTIRSFGDGELRLIGAGGPGLGSNHGISLTSVNSLITSEFGDIHVTGTGGAGTGDFNIGIRISENASIRSTGTGANAAEVTLSGTGGAGDQFNRGIQLSGAAPRLSTVDGDLALIGSVGAASGSGNEGINFFSGRVFSTGAGDLIVDGTGLGASGEGILLQGNAVIEALQTGDIDLIARSVSSPQFIATGGSRIGSRSGTGNIMLTADTLDFRNAESFEAGGNLFIQPLDPATSIGIAGGTGTHNLDATELSRLADGFSAITIGRTDGTGQVTVDAVTFNDPVTIVGGGVNLAGTLTANENPVELIANGGEIRNARLALVPNVDTSELRLTGMVTAADPTGTLAVDGDVVLSENDIFRIEIEGTNTIEFNRISATGDVTIEDNVELVTQPRGGFVPSIGDQFIIVDNLGANPVNGEFVGLPEGARIENFLGSNLDARITYQGGTGNEVALIVVDRTTLDFGDAPDTYQTLTDSFGPWHTATGPRLGDLRDFELDGVPNSSASGDDDSGVDDEDGVMFGVVGVGMTVAGLNVDVQNAGTAQVNAWIDFDGDGIFQDDEQILTNRVVFGGIQTLNYDVNADAVAGETFARVRLNSSGGLGIGGFASDGEVEDYAVTVLPRPAVDSIVVNGGDVQRSLLTELVVTFDSEVDAPAEAFEIRERLSGTVLNTLQVSNVVNGAGQTVSTLTFGAGGNLIFDRANGEHTLVDGNYVLEIDSSLIQLAGGGPTLESDIEFGTDDVDGFFRIFGDSDGDRDVDGQDFGRFAQTFPKTLGEDGFNSVFDSDGDDDVDGQDFGRFSANFLQTI